MSPHDSQQSGHARPGPSGAEPSHEHAAEHTHGGMGLYLTVFASLCVLTLVSFGIANSWLMDTPSIGWTGMMAVSCAKALLVILFFMHLKWEANWKYVLTIPASIMSIFLVLMLVPDIGRRTNYYSEERWLHAAPPQVQHDVERTAKEGQADSPAKGH